LKSSSRGIDCLVGFSGGVLGGAASISGALPSMWLSMRPWPKSHIRAVLQPFNVAVLSVTVAMLFWNGAYDGRTLNALVITVPTTLLAAQVGIMVFHHIEDAVFRRLMIAMNFALGIGILISEMRLLTG